MGRLWRHRPFIVFLVGQVVSGLGDQAHLVAFALLVLQLTDDPAALAGVLATVALPRSILMLTSGIATDRFSARRVILVANLLEGALVAALALLWASGLTTVWHLYLFAAATGLVSAWVLPAQRTMMPYLFDSQDTDHTALVQAGNGVLESAMSLVLVIGPALGALLASLSLVWGLALNSLTFFVSAATMVWLGRASYFPPAPSSTNPLHAFREGLAYAWGDRPLRRLLLSQTGVGLLFRGPLQVGTPLLALHVLGNEADMGWLLAMLGAGLLLASLWGARYAVRYLERAAHWAALGWGAAMILAGLSGGLALYAVFFLAGLAQGLRGLFALTAAQTEVPAPLVGRTVSLLIFVTVAPQPLALLWGGAVADQLGAGALFVVNGALLAVIAGVVLWQAYRGPLPRHTSEGADGPKP